MPEKDEKKGAPLAPSKPAPVKRYLNKGPRSFRVIRGEGKEGVWMPGQMIDLPSDHVLARSGYREIVDVAKIAPPDDSKAKLEAEVRKLEERIAVLDELIEKNDLELKDSQAQVESLKAELEKALKAKKEK